ncbi:polyamine aminopropyltransferase [Wohlfahrtiimonas larvae]|uniref:Polyamine aminopropyltransferase n=1 Tax=Wohlfahrtiimonas larvae TaxID=1157986 RepID=A0ABP9MXK3_9GAMM|nr:polyamine aminopropyltransferase [Wohlfahrtiimonas larvae]
MFNRTLIISVFVVASCGLAYELIIAALASYLLGDSILQFSTIIGGYLFAMGIGAHLTRYIKDEDALTRFIDIELLVGLVGGICALLLFILFGLSSAPFRVIVYSLVFIIGTIVGMEIPLVMRVMNQYKTDFKELVSKVLTFDYMGALAVSLLFPLVLAPKLGMARSALLFGILNTLVAIFTCHVFRAQLAKYKMLMIKGNIVLIALLTAFFFANDLTETAEQHYFGDPIVYQYNSPYQRLVLTKYKDDTRLFINGNLQFSSMDEARYHEALVLPVMENVSKAENILILGGGDGLATREVLKYPDVKSITLVDLDPKMTELFRTSAQLTLLNDNALNNEKVTIVNEDAAKWLERQTKQYDVIIIDLPDPSNFSLGKLYSVPMYRLVKQHLTSNGVMVVQATSPYFAPHAFGSINKTLQAANLKTLPYHAYVPSFGEWGYILANRDGNFMIPESYQVATRYLDKETTAQMFKFPLDMPVRTDLEANHLNTQILVKYFEQDWRKVTP